LSDEFSAGPVLEPRNDTASKSVFGDCDNMASVGVESSKWSARGTEVTSTDHKILIQLETIPISGLSRLGGKDKLGLSPLPLHDGDLVDLRTVSEPFRRPDPYAALWRRLTAKPRPGFVMDPIAWGQFPGAGEEENPTCDAAERAEAGDFIGARELLMEVLCADLRCLDAHAHLGNLEFDDSPKLAIVHYEIGMRIGELSLPPAFDGLLQWGHIYNRPYLRCLHGYGLCLWRMGQLPHARQVFERILSLNPNDNQGVRFCWGDVRSGRSWDEMQERELQHA
jgi:hypothetical protein